MAPEEQRRRRGYGQFCAVAKALDVVGERWTLLVVRDLLIGPKRYTDLREGLPGIATDLLADRLRALEDAGLVHRRRLPRPAPAVVYELTERGRLLGPVVAGLARVGFEFLDEPPDDAVILAERLVLSLRASFRPETTGGRDRTYRLELGDEQFSLAVREGELEVARGAVPQPDLTLRTDPRTLARLLRGDLQPREARSAGVLDVDGDRGELDRFLATFVWERAVGSLAG